MFFRAPEAGYYMFTVVVREPFEDFAAGSIMRTLTTDPEDAVMLCRAEIGYEAHQTGTCTVRELIKLSWSSKSLSLNNKVWVPRTILLEHFFLTLSWICSVSIPGDHGTTCWWSGLRHSGRIFRWFCRQQVPSGWIHFIHRTPDQIWSRINVLSFFVMKIPQ